VTASQEPSVSQSKYVKISQSEAAEMMLGGAVVLDVRTAEEYNEGHIRNAVLLPGGEIPEKAGDVIPSPSQTVLVYCKTGVRSETASRLLIEMGYTGVYDFGGIEDWPGEIVVDGEMVVTEDYFEGTLRD
jgi:rhodanese-related sulfurtransferase